MSKKLTSMVEEEVYEGLTGLDRTDQRFLNDLARSSPRLDSKRISSMAGEERGGARVVEGVIGDLADDPR